MIKLVRYSRPRGGGDTPIIILRSGRVVAKAKEEKRERNRREREKEREGERKREK